MKSANDVATKCDDIAENCSQEVAESCYHNINNKYRFIVYFLLIIITSQACISQSFL